MRSTPMRRDSTAAVRVVARSSRPTRTQLPPPVQTAKGRATDQRIPRLSMSLSTAFATEEMSVGTTGLRPAREPDVALCTADQPTLLARKPPTQTPNASRTKGKARAQGTFTSRLVRSRIGRTRATSTKDDNGFRRRLDEQPASEVQGRSKAHADRARADRTRVQVDCVMLLAERAQSTGGDWVRAAFVRAAAACLSARRT